MRIFEKTFLTEDEGYNPEGKIGDTVERCLKSLKMDPYNHQYVVRVTVDRVDEPPPESDDDDES